MADPLAGIDTAWLRGVLGRAGRDVDGVELLHAQPVGEGNTSEVARLTLADGRTLIAKLPRLLPDGSTPDSDLFGYGREVAAYRAFGVAPPFRIPRCDAAEQDAGGFTLILEDLGAGCRPGDQIGGCSIADADAVAAELTAMHAAWWRSPAIDGLDWPSRRWRNADRTAAMAANGAAVMRADYRDHLSGAALDVIDAAVPLVRDWAGTAPFAPTLIHADPRVDNIIFEEDAGGGGRACLIDLQSISVGDAAFDLAYFLTGSLKAEDRAACERRLVQAHAAAIRAVDPAYDDETAWRRYRQFLLCGLVSTISAAGLLGNRANVPQIVALASRNCAAVIALDGLDAARQRIAEGC